MNRTPTAPDYGSARRGGGLLSAAAWRRGGHWQATAWRTVVFATIAVIYAFLLLPLLIVIATSLNPTERNAFPPYGLSLRWYGEFLASESFTDAFVFSLILGSFAAVGATLIGFLAAYGIVRLLGPRRDLVQSLTFLPIMIPHILIGISLLLALTMVPIPEMIAFVAGHIIIALPFTLAAILASFAGVDASLELAAMSLGASRWRAVREIVLPLIAPGLLSAMLFAFIVSFGDVYIALFLSVPGKTTLPIEIFTYMEWESTPAVAAITSIQVLMIVVMGLLVERLIGLRKVLRF